MADYTKGEWMVVTNGNNLLAIAIQGRNICSFEPLFLRGEKTSLYRQLGGEDEANAHLIAKSPRMYEALKDMVEWYKARGFDRELPQYRNVEEVIKEVEGK